jgi:lambda family phage portal protein
MAFLKILDASGNKIPMMSNSNPFQGASFTRRLDRWGTSTLGPNSVLYSNIGTLRARSRELVRNDPSVTGALDTIVSNLVGSGITPRWNLDNPELKKAIQELWADWTLEADFDQIADFYGLQTLAARCMIESGEVLIRIIPQRVGNLAVPLQLQVIEPDHLDESFTTQASNGNQIRMGIEFNKSGKRVAYHLFKEHPGEHFLENDTATRVRIPANQILHIYRPLRPGQKRGRPWLSAVIATLHELGKYLDAEQVRKSGAAMFGGFITAPVGEADNVPNLFGSSDEDQEPDILALEPGTFPTLPMGYDVKFSEPAEVGNSYEPFIKHQERRVSKGLGLPYEKYSGDLQNAKYTTIRAADIEFHRFCKQIISNILAFQLCRPVARSFLNQAVLSGAIKITDYTKNSRKYNRIFWIHDGFSLLDPSKEVKPKIEEIRAGLNTRANILGEKGLDIEKVDAENAQDNQRAGDLGLKYDSDPRQDKKSNDK